MLDKGFDIDIAIEDEGVCKRQNCNNCKMGKFFFENGMKDREDDLCNHRIVFILAKVIKTFVHREDVAKPEVNMQC